MVGENKLEDISGNVAYSLTVKNALNNGLTNLGLNSKQVQKMQCMINLLNNEDDKGKLFYAR